jgi:hypothetical protein
MNLERRTIIQVGSRKALGSGLREESKGCHLKNMSGKPD